MMALHQQLEAALQNPEQFAARAKEAEQLRSVSRKG